VHLWDTEDRHDGVADELLDDAPVSLDDLARGSKYSASTRRRLSGSSRSPRAVEPVTSEKTTVTTLRCSLAAAGAVSEAAQALQNLAPAGFSWPQLGQTCTRQRLEGRAQVHNGESSTRVATRASSVAIRGQTPFSPPRTV
jgi:hypothetical protein